MTPAATKGYMYGKIPKVSSPFFMTINNNTPKKVLGIILPTPPNKLAHQ